MQLRLIDSSTGRLAGPKLDPQFVKRNMYSRRNDLKEMIDFESGFLDDLVSKGTLSNEHASEILNTAHNRVDKILDFLLYRYAGDYGEVMEALVESGQEHVAVFIISKGGNFFFYYLEVFVVPDRRCITTKFLSACF